MPVSYRWVPSSFAQRTSARPLAQLFSVVKILTNVTAQRCLASAPASMYPTE